MSEPNYLGETPAARLRRLERGVVDILDVVSERVAALKQKIESEFATQQQDESKRAEKIARLFEDLDGEAAALRGNIDEWRQEKKRHTAGGGG